MYQIRKSIFETSSSSIHTICITKDPISDDDIHIPKEPIYIRLEKFGSETTKYVNLPSKLSYIYAAILSFDDFKHRFKNKEIRNIYLQQFKKLLNKYGFSYTLEKNEDVNNLLNPYSHKIEEIYIDHGYELRPFLEKILYNEFLFKKFLFKTKSYIQTTNDGERNYEDILKVTAKGDFDIFIKGN